MCIGLKLHLDDKQWTALSNMHEHTPRCYNPLVVGLRSNHGHNPGNIYGPGIYFSTTAHLSCQYAYRLSASEATKHGGGDMRQILRCRVLAGVPHIANNPCQYTIPPLVPDTKTPKSLR